MAVDAPVRWRRRVLFVVGLVVLVVFATTWLASDRTEVHDLGVAAEVLIVNDTGPVRVRSLDEFDGEGADSELAIGGVVVRSSASWLLRGPRVEQLTIGAESAFRITCPSRLPCRASVEVFVPDGVALSIVAADDLVQVDSFDGAMSIFAGDGGVALGSVAGSVSITSAGPVTGTTLGPSELTVDVVDDDVSLTFLDPPMVLAVLGGPGDVSIELPTGEDYAIDAEGDSADVAIESSLTSERLVSVRSEGAVSIEYFEPEDDG